MSDIKIKKIEKWVEKGRKMCYNLISVRVCTKIVLKKPFFGGIYDIN